MNANGRQSWELRIERLGMHQHGALTRTYARYAVAVDGVLQPVLCGFMVEAGGPGDNSVPDNGKRIEAGRYPLTTHFGRFVTLGYAASDATAGETPMPAIRLLDTNQRTGILIHPVHPPDEKLYVASIGCLNPAGALREDESIDFRESRRRVIDLISSLQAFQPDAFMERQPTAITGASVLVVGEPVHRLRAEDQGQIFDPGLPGDNA